MTDCIKRKDLLELYNLHGVEVENAKVPLNVVIQNIKDMPSADVVTREQYEQIRWERDVALHQLEEIGKGLGEKMVDVVEIKKEGEWDMFDLISSAYYGKGMYFKQDNGIVYSRHSGEYMTVDEAIREFISLIDGENIAFVPSVTTAWTDGEAPTYVLQKHGKWEKHDDGIMFWWECSECHQDPWYDREELYDYCPSCGAKMEFGESEEE